MEESERFKECLQWSLGLDNRRSDVAVADQKQGSNMKQSEKKRSEVNLGGLSTIFNPSPYSASTETDNNSSKINSIKGFSGAGTVSGSQIR